MIIASCFIVLATKIEAMVEVNGDFLK